MVDIFQDLSFDTQKEKSLKIILLLEEIFSLYASKKS